MVGKACNLMDMNQFNCIACIHFSLNIFHFFLNINGIGLQFNNIINALRYPAVSLKVCFFYDEFL